MKNPNPDYAAHPWEFLHGRCKPCGRKFGWRPREGRRLKDGPACPGCGRLLTRTTVRVAEFPTIEVVEPLWNKLEAQRLRQGPAPGTGDQDASSGP